MGKINLEFSLDELQVEVEDTEQQVNSKSIKIENHHLFYRMNSERKLEEILPRDPQIGASYHCISAGSVDIIGYLLWIVRWQKLSKVMISTWCIAQTDIGEIDRQIKLGNIGCVDFYVGEILPGSYRSEYKAICDLCKRTGGKVVVFRNHSKVIAGYGEKSAFAIESSANVNTNPRTEQTTVTFLKALADFYFEFYGEIISFDKEWRSGKNKT